MMDEEEMVQICLGGLAQRYRLIRTAICTRDKTIVIFRLAINAMVKENHVGVSRSTQFDNRMLYTEADRLHGHGE